MVRIYRSNIHTSVSQADIFLIGVPDESKSLAKRKGTNRAPDIIRSAFNEAEFFEREGKTIPVSPMRGSHDNKRIVDVGNVNREDLYQLIVDLVSFKKIPIIIGGDHSITTIALRAIGSVLGKIGLFYFDAHPDFVSSMRNYYGSVLMDSAHSIEYKKSMLIGTRAAELEELENAQRVGLEIISPMDFVELGILKLADKVVARAVGHKKYISIDLDCVDPAFAPGVSLPSVGGLSSIDLIYLVKRAIDFGLVGIDIVELSPDFDINHITANLAARIISECIGSIKVYR
ncbi:MAG: arginase family protein [Candidatus Nitrosopolaris sp.]|jgi:agmatinase